MSSVSSIVGVSHHGTASHYGTNAHNFGFSDPTAEAIEPFVCLLGESEAIVDVIRFVERVGPTEASVLLTGESGSGKQLTARAIHQHSARRGKPFIAINCGAIPPGLIEAELFGYEKDSSTAAIRAHAGAFERAQGGTLLLDEVTELPLEIQARLLRLLETCKFYRVGATVEHTSDVRVIAASSRCPLQAVQSGRLREDLLYRLAVFPIALPSLRTRGEDAEILASHFLEQLNSQACSQKRLSASSRLMLRRHSWPGNVRELKNCVERAFILSDAVLELAPLLQNSALRTADSGTSPAATSCSGGVEDGRLDIRVGSRIDDVEKSLIEATLDHFKGNKRRAADALGCSLKTLYNKLNGYSQRQACANS